MSYQWPCITNWLEQLASPFYQQGYVVLEQAIPADLCWALYQDVQQQQLKAAGVGRQGQHQLDQQIRRDQTAWLNPDNQVQQQYLELMAKLQQDMNQRCFLGLIDFEAHYARYQQGDFYQKHLDAFVGRSNRVLSTVCYLNTAEQGGELVLYDEQDQLLSKVQPKAGTLVVFESCRFPHEVLAASETRYSIAGWFRHNSSIQGRIDPAL
ncbi:MAG: 2OG-Fe(II) oxygenase [Gammaproteobacteria bacterium]|nr:2OG-Fe(II) oxygenase [Gammaproteobacteria bacterium]MBU2056153.1 2OG-Fe(II) oxygenase [Gammaproteobacteria bacterium]MBU2175661.1 2OG-Fe(II) oxygenase [Gammaproteobacteria bacterium]MBU2245368.1 2OG-Fe(II) oxygenase [Gammaproteobacteria bacterium]MBU2345759.1 2OG-Fe(II) oxygenase [Gammaproteobacteria bacterium]